MANVNSGYFVSGENIFSDTQKMDKSFSGCDMVPTITIKTNKGNVEQVIGNISTLSYSIVQNKIPVRGLGNINAKGFVDGPRTIAGTIVFAVLDKHWMYEVYDKLKKLGVYNTDHFIADELPPFDITVSFENEYGYGSRMAIYGIHLMQEGQVMSISDILTENTYQYTALDIDYMNDWYTMGENTDKTSSALSGTVVNIISTTVEPIPSKSNAKNITSSTDVVLDTNFTYSNVKTSSSINFDIYKRLVTDQYNIYVERIKQYLSNGSIDTVTYNTYLQIIKTGYNSKINDGISYYK